MVARASPLFLVAICVAANLPHVHATNYGYGEYGDPSEEWNKDYYNYDPYNDPDWYTNYDPFSYYDYDDDAEGTGAMDSKLCWTDGDTVVYNGTFCDLSVTGSGSLSNLDGSLYGYYRMEGCHNEYPMYKLRTPPNASKMEEHMHFVYSVDFHDWAIYDVQNKDIDDFKPLAFGGGSKESTPNQVPQGTWKMQYAIAGYSQPPQDAGDYVSRTDFSVVCADAEHEVMPEIVKRNGEKDEARDPRPWQPVPSPDSAARSPSSLTSAGARDSMDALSLDSSHEHGERPRHNEHIDLLMFASLGIMMVFCVFLGAFVHWYLTVTRQCPQPTTFGEGMHTYSMVVDDEL